MSCFRLLYTFFEDNFSDFFFENIFCLGSKITNFDWFYVAFSLIRKNEMKIRRFCLFVDVEIVMIIDIDMINDN